MELTSAISPGGISDGCKCIYLIATPHVFDQTTVTSAIDATPVSFTRFMISQRVLSSIGVYPYELVGHIIYSITHYRRHEG